MDELKERMNEKNEWAPTSHEIGDNTCARQWQRRRNTQRTESKEEQGRMNEWKGWLKEAANEIGDNTCRRKEEERKRKGRGKWNNQRRRNEMMEEGEGGEIYWKTDGKTCQEKSGWIMERINEMNETEPSQRSTKGAKPMGTIWMTEQPKNTEAGKNQKRTCSKRGIR